ncbi:MAG: hypothetical protein ACI9HE_003691 [Planctomycetota bacterium]|jgi:hypothetical protein
MANAPLSVLVIGTGKRVLSTALPAFAAHADKFQIARLYARRAKTITAAGSDYEVGAFENFSATDLEGIDLVYLAVTKDAVPQVLAKLTSLNVANADVLIDTPVVRFKHFRHCARLNAFRNAWVAEDIAFLPWLDTLKAAFAAGDLGSLRTVILNQSAYAYHGVSLAKSVSGCNTIKIGRRKANTAHAGTRFMSLSSGVQIHIIEPRNYEAGSMIFAGSKGVVADYAFREDTHVLEPLVENGQITAFRCGEHSTKLTPAESALTAGDPEGATVTHRMNACKRVGFARLIESIAAGGQSGGGYPVQEAMDDMVVDYHLEKFRTYRANPFTSARSPLARMLLSLLSRAGG